MPSDVPSNIDALSHKKFWATVHERVRKIYSDQFLAALGKEFGFEGLYPEIAEAIRDIAFRYLRDRRIHDSPGDLKPIRDFYKTLGNSAKRLAEALEKAREFDIQVDIRAMALELGEPPPRTSFPDLTPHQRASGFQYLRELQRLTRLLQATADEQIRRTLGKRGPKGNFALEELVRKTADFVIDTLKRKYRFNHHNLAKPGLAWDFVNRLLAPLTQATGDKIRPETIKTAIRNENNRRRELRRRYSK